MSQNVLPPRLTGKVRGRVSIRISHYQSPELEVTGAFPKREVVRVLWWGQENPEEIRIPRNLDSAIITYDVVTAEKVSPDCCFPYEISGFIAFTFSTSAII